MRATHSSCTPRCAFTTHAKELLPQFRAFLDGEHCASGYAHALFVRGRPHSHPSQR